MCKITDMFYQEGVEKGKEIGLEQGKQLGKEIGLEQGKEIGLIQGKDAIAKKMIMKGNLSLETIMEYTDLSLDTLKKIQKELMASV